MRTIYKYEIFPGGGWINLPVEAKILTVAAQGESLMMWVELDPDATEKEGRYVEVFGTGHQIYEDMGIERRYIGTASLGGLVWHVYERLN